MKNLRIILLVLIIIGLGLLATQKLWVPGLVNQILKSEGKSVSVPTGTPTQMDTALWQTSSDRTDGVTFKYPATLPAVYIHTAEWPPKVAVTNSAFSCTNGGKETEQAGVTAKEVINGTTYCVTKESEGAAGSTYINYAYASEVQNKLVIFTFTLRETDCGNYPEPQMTACNNERASFTIDRAVDLMFQTLTLP